MYRQPPIALTVSHKDSEFLAAVARKVLGNSTIAATNSQKLAEYGFDVHRIDALIPVASVAVQTSGFVFKKVADETPDNFGLFVRVAAPAKSQPH